MNTGRIVGVKSARRQSFILRGSKVRLSRVTYDVDDLLEREAEFEDDLQIFFLTRQIFLCFTKYRLRLVVYGPLELLVAGHQVVEEPHLRAAAHVHCNRRECTVHSSVWQMAKVSEKPKTYVSIF